MTTLMISIFAVVVLLFVMLAVWSRPRIQNRESKIQNPFTGPA